MKPTVSITTIFDSDLKISGVPEKIKLLQEQIMLRYPELSFHSLTKEWNKDTVVIKTDESLIYEPSSDKVSVSGRILGGLIYDSGTWAKPAPSEI